MKMLKKHGKLMIFGLALLIIALILTACGTSNQQTAKNDETPKPANVSGEPAKASSPEAPATVIPSQEVKTEQPSQSQPAQTPEVKPAEQKAETQPAKPEQPTPAPEPKPEPAPQPAPQPKPEPAPTPAPEPTPQPAPQPEIPKLDSNVDYLAKIKDHVPDITYLRDNLIEYTGVKTADGHSSILISKYNSTQYRIAIVPNPAAYDALEKILQIFTDSHASEIRKETEKLNANNRHNELNLNGIKVYLNFGPTGNAVTIMW